MDRRHFMGIGAATVIAASKAEAASMSAFWGRTIADWGVEPNLERDQSALMQKAVNELAGAGQPVAIPAGRYRFVRLQLPSKTAVFGVPGLTVIAAAAPDLPIFYCSGARDISFRGVSFAGLGIAARECENVSIQDCQVLASDSDGILCSANGFFIANNRLASCAKSALWIEGDGMITSNLIESGGQFGMRLGGRKRLGTMTVVNNSITGANVGIGVSNAELGYALIAMNMISGAKSGGIRALNGDELIGKDLTKGGSEAFRNLAIAANVSV